MERITYRKTLDVHKSGTQFMLQGFQTGDNMSRVIEISLMASGDALDFPLERVVAMMYVTTPGAKEPSINECTIRDNKVVYDVLPIVEEGITMMQLKIIETSPEGATSVLASPEFAVEVTRSNVDDGSAEQSTTFTALEDAMAKAKTVYDERFLRMELDSDCIFKAWYADGTYYETDVLRELFLNGNVLLSESYAHGGTGVRAGEDTDNSKHYSNVSKSEALRAKEIMEDSEDILEEVKLHGVYTAFSVNFETGEVEYVSPSFKFNINLETGELDAIGQTYTFDDEIGRVVENWLGTKGILISDLQDISQTHSGQIKDLQDGLQELADRVTPIEKGGTGVTSLEGLKDALDIDKYASIPSFLTFAGNVNADMVAAAFGKGNEDDMIGIGNALKMYANFKGNTENISFLDGYDKYSDLIKAHKQKLIANSTLYTLIGSSPYANGVLKDTVSGLPDIVLYDSGATEYLNLSGATIKTEQTKNGYTYSKDFSGNVLNVTAEAYHMSDSGGNTSPAAKCTIPLSQPLPDLRGYRNLNVKFSGSAASGFGSIMSTYEQYTKAEIVVAGQTLSIPCKSSNMDLTGQTKALDSFSSFVSNPVENNIEICLYLMLFEDYTQRAFVNIEKIWISEI